MFLNASKEADKYPPHIIESALLALAIKKVNTVKELDPLLAQLKDFTQVSNRAPQQYTKKFYDNFEQTMTQPGRNAGIKFTEILKASPEDLIFHTLSYDKYSKIYPIMLGTGASRYKGNPFSDCGESSFRNFFQYCFKW